MKKRLRHFGLIALAETGIPFAYGANNTATELQTISKNLFGAVKPGEVACASCHDAKSWSAGDISFSINAKSPHRVALTGDFRVDGTAQPALVR